MSHDATEILSSATPNDPTPELPFELPGLVLPHAALQRIEWRQGWPERVTAEHAAVQDDTDTASNPVLEEEEEIELESQELEPADISIEEYKRAVHPAADEEFEDLDPLSQTGELDILDVEAVEPESIRLSSADVELAPEPEPGPTDGGKTEPPPTPSQPRQSALTPIETAQQVPTNEVDFLMSEILEAEATPADRERKTSTDWWDEIFDDTFLRATNSPTSRTDREVAFLVGSLAPVEGARILDVGCGTGRHAIELAARGMSVVGVDKSRVFLNQALVDASAREVDVQFLLGDMRELDFQSEFDGIYCVETTFGYFDDATNFDVLRRMVHALKPGARLLIDQSNRDHVIRACPRRTWWETNDIVLMDDVKFDYVTSRLLIERSLVDGDKAPWEQHISIRLYTTHELCQMMQALGLEILGVSGDIATPGVYFGPENRSNIVTGRKPIAG